VRTKAKTDGEDGLNKESQAYGNNELRLSDLIYKEFTRKFFIFLDFSDDGQPKLLILKDRTGGGSSQKAGPR